jgi:hypothetical protein
VKVESEKLRVKSEERKGIEVGSKRHDWSPNVIAKAAGLWQSEGICPEKQPGAGDREKEYPISDRGYQISDMI